MYTKGLLIATLLVILGAILVSAMKIGIGEPVSVDVDAVDRALIYVGELNVGRQNTSVIVANTRVVILEDTVTPFIGRYLHGRSCWEVPLENVSVLNNRSIRGYGADSPKDIYVYIDSLTGRLACIKLLDHGMPKDYQALRPDRISAEGQLEMQGEDYGSLPDSDPQMTFVETLDSAIGGPPVSREIDAYFILWKDLKPKMRPTWILNCYEMPPIVPSREGRSVPGKFLDHQRIFVDDSTGHSWSRLTPQPISWPPTGEELRQGTQTDLAPVKLIPVAPPELEEDSTK